MLPAYSLRSTAAIYERRWQEDAVSESAVFLAAHYKLTPSDLWINVGKLCEEQNCVSVREADVWGYNQASVIIHHYPQ